MARARCLFGVGLVPFFTLLGIEADDPGRSGAGREDSAKHVTFELRGSLQNPAWSPDGKKLVFTRFRKGYNQEPADLFVGNKGGRKLKKIVSDGSANVNLPGSAWSKNQRIFFSSSREPHDELFSIAYNGKSGSEKKITERKRLVAYEPSVSADGKWVVFETHRIDLSGNGVITKRRANGRGSYTRLTSKNDDCRQPNWSPDGRKIVYQKRSSGKWNIWSMRSNGRGKKQLTKGTAESTDPSFSPDGKWVVYSREGSQDKYGDIFKVLTSGSRPERVTNSTGYDGAPSWSPDGSRITFESRGLARDRLKSKADIWVIDSK